MPNLRVFTKRAMCLLTMAATLVSTSAMTVPMVEEEDGPFDCPPFLAETIGYDWHPGTHLIPWHLDHSVKIPFSPQEWGLLSQNSIGQGWYEPLDWETTYGGHDWIWVDGKVLHQCFKFGGYYMVITNTLVDPEGEAVIYDPPDIGGTSETSVTEYEICYESYEGYWIAGYYFERVTDTWCETYGEYQT